MHLHVGGGATEVRERHGFVQGVAVFGVRVREACSEWEDGGRGLVERGDGEAGFAGDVGEGDVAFDERVGGGVWLGEGDVQDGDTGAEFDVFDREQGWAGMCAAEKLRVEVDGVALVTVRVSGLHVDAGGDQKAGCGVAAIGNCRVRQDMATTGCLGSNQFQYTIACLNRRNKCALILA